MNAITSVRSRSQRRASASRLVRDEHGAIAIMALFMAVFMVGMLAYVHGIGTAVLQREQMQDAADAAAF